MPRIGMICHAFRGHLDPMLMLARELKRRECDVGFIAVPDAESAVAEAGFRFTPVGSADLGEGHLKDFSVELGRRSGMAGLDFCGRYVARVSEAMLRDGDAVVGDGGFDLLVVDQDVHAGGTLADRHALPFVNVSNAINMYQGKDVPPFFLPWRFDDSLWSRIRNRVAYSLIKRLPNHPKRVVDGYRREWKLPVFKSLNDNYSRWAQIAQQPIELEFPRRLPDCFHFTAPFHLGVSQLDRPFPWDRLDGRPLVYASLGTLQNRLPEVFGAIAESCAGLKAQLVISLNNAPLDDADDLPGDPIVCTGYAPQLDLIQNASMVVTHCGMNTVLQSLAHGVPMVAVPITNDQPGTAARLQWAGAAEVVPLKKLTAGRLREAVRLVLTEQSYTDNAQRIGDAISRIDGVATAAEIIEQVLATGEPVSAALFEPTVRPLTTPVVSIGTPVERSKTPSRRAAE